MAKPKGTFKVNGVPKPKTVTFGQAAIQETKQVYKWWLAENDRDLCAQLCMTAAFLKESQLYKQRQASIFARLYGNMSLFNFIGINMTKMDQLTGLPSDRPTFNLIQSCIDTLVAKHGQNKPTPTFLTDAGDYKERRLAQQLNNFILGEFYQTKAYERGVKVLKDALIMGTGVMKVYETDDHKVGLERKLYTEILVDPNEAIYGPLEGPRSLIEMKLMDRDVLLARAPNSKIEEILSAAAQAYPDNSSDASKSVSDQIIIVEGFHLPSIKGAKDGRHTIACSAGVIYDEPYEKDRFPYVFTHYSDRVLGFWGQGLAEQLMGTQIEINSLLFNISRAIKLVGVPRVFVEAGSKVSKAAFNDDIGTIIPYTGIKPIYEVAPCVPQEMYAQLDRLIERGYQQCGVSTMQAGSQKPAGLNSGEAIRTYADEADARSAILGNHYDQLYIDLSYLIVDKAKDIAERDGKYQTIYPGKDGTKTIDLPKMSILQDPFVIQCFNTSSLPKDPAGRMQKVTEMIQAGMITVQEGRRLLDYPDLNQVEKLANASEERIYKILDLIVEDGKYTPPDPFMDLDLANQLVVQYYNLYSANKLEETRCQQLRDFFSQVQSLKQEAMMAQMPTVQPQQPAVTPAANPQALPASPLVPNGNPGGAA